MKPHGALFCPWLSGRRWFTRTGKCSAADDGVHDHGILGRELNRPELDREVPEMKKPFTIQLEGTGNWVFNTAYAGSFKAIRAYVARMSDLAELEDWIQKGVRWPFHSATTGCAGEGKASGHLSFASGSPRQVTDYQ